MQLLTAKEKAATNLAGCAAFSTSNDLSTADSEGDHCTANERRLASLRAGFSRHGLSLGSLDGSELLVSGPGMPSRALPDLRCAYVMLRRLNGGLA